MTLNLLLLNERIEKLQKLRDLASDNEAAQWIREMVSGTAPMTEKELFNGVAPEPTSHEAVMDIWGRKKMEASLR